MTKTLFIQRFTNGSNHAVHHAGGSNHIDTGTCWSLNLLLQIAQSRIIIDIIIGNNATVAMIGIFTKAVIADNEHVRLSFFGNTDNTSHQAIIAPGIATAIVFMGRYTKQQYRFYTVRPCTLNHLGQLSFRVTINTRHGLNRDRLINIFFNKDR